MASKDLICKLFFTTEISDVTQWLQNLHLAQENNSHKGEEKGNTTYLFLH